MTTLFHERHGTAAAWTTANTVLAVAQIGVESDTGKFKIGDGTTAWSSLPYAVPDVPVLLIENGGDVPQDTPVGTLIFEKAAS